MRRSMQHALLVGSLIFAFLLGGRPVSAVALDIDSFQSPLFISFYN